MKKQISLREKTGIEFPLPKEIKTKPTSNQPQKEISNKSGFGSKTDNQCTFPANLVLLPVAEIVDHQQRINHQAARKRRNGHGQIPGMRHDIISTPYRHKAKKHQHQEVAPTLISQFGVKISKKDASNPYRNHLPAAIEKQSKPAYSGKGCGKENGPLHLPGRNPALGTCPLGA